MTKSKLGEEKEEIQDKSYLYPIIFLFIGFFMVAQMLLIQRNSINPDFVLGLLIIMSEAIQLLFMALGFLFIIYRRNFRNAP